MQVSIKQIMTVGMGFFFLCFMSCYELIAKENEPEGYLPNRSLEQVREIENRNRGYDIEVEGISIFDY